MKTLTATYVALVLTGLAATSADAQTIGTFRWQLSPFCNVLSLTIVQQESTYQLVGTDDGCGTTSVAPVTGTAIVASASSVVMGFSVISPAAGSRQYSATINLTNFNGTWSDGDGSGTFTFNPVLPAAGLARGPAERVFAFGQIRDDGSIRNSSSRVSTVTRVSAGRYCVNFTETPAQFRLEGAVVALAGGGTTAVFARNTNGQQPFGCPLAGALAVNVVNGAGVNVDGRFSFVVP